MVENAGEFLCSTNVRFALILPGNLNAVRKINTRNSADDKFPFSNFVLLLKIISTLKVKHPVHTIQKIYKIILYTL